MQKQKLVWRTQKVVEVFMRAAKEPPKVSSFIRELCAFTIIAFCNRKVHMQSSEAFNAIENVFGSGR